MNPSHTCLALFLFFLVGLALGQSIINQPDASCVTFVE
jgi:hypothetical protein